MQLKVKLTWWDMATAKLKHLSNLLDEKCFPICDVLDPVPAGERERCDAIDRAGGNLSRAVKRCETAEQCELLAPVITRMRLVYGNNAQVNGWIDSLAMELVAKERALQKVSK